MSRVARHTFVAAGLLLAEVATGCKFSALPDRTEFVLEINSNIPVPEQMDAVAVHAARADGLIMLERVDAIGGGANQVRLPEDVTLLPVDKRTEAFKVRVEGLKNGETVVSRTILTSFVPEKSWLLRILLARECMGVNCPEGLTCDRGMCVDPEVMPGPTSGPPVDGGVPLLVEPSSDGGARVDEVPASIPDVSPEAPPISDVVSDVPVHPDVVPDLPTVQPDAPLVPDLLADLPHAKPDMPLDLPLGPEPGAEPGPEWGAEPGPEPGQELGPEPGPEPRPEPGPEPSPEPGPESGPEPGPDAGAVDAQGYGIQPLSCAGLPANCGSAGNESCCASILVPGGTYYRSYDGVDFTDMSYPATVADFYLDKYEITVGRFRAFVNAGMGTQASPPASGAGAHPLIANSGWDPSWDANLAPDTASLESAIKCFSSYTWTDLPGANENKPANCLTWWEAFAFCAWDGGRLATEAEWNYAAAGGNEQRYYPWSSPASSTTIDDTYAVYCGGSCSIRNVGSKSPKGDGKWGHADLAGNVWEWGLDGWATLSYPPDCDNCAKLAGTANRTIRGGCMGNPPSYLRAAYSDGNIPDFRTYAQGGRCVRLVSPPDRTAGTSCNGSVQCQPGLTCLDGVCCTQSSCPSCQNCGANGQCNTTVANREDLTGAKCVGTQACDATGACKLKSGETCGNAEECLSGSCVDSKCCAQSCGVCKACTGANGTCVTVAGADDPDTCTDDNTCDTEGACKKKDAQACSDGSECASRICTGNVCSATTPLASIQDAYVWSVNAPNDAGNDQYLFVGGTLYDGGPQYRTYMQFAQSSFPATASSAVLWIYMWGQNGFLSGNIDFHLVNAAWDEQTITWDNQPSSSPAALVSVPAGNLQGAYPDWIAFDVTPLINAWIANPSSNFGFVITNDSGYGFPYFWSSQAFDSALAPHLDITP